MTDSLVLDGLYELIGGVTNPEYRLGPSTDHFGHPVPDTAVIAGSLLDGDRVTGQRSANRSVALPVYVTGTDRTDLAANVNRLLQIVDAQAKASFTLTWTPDGGLPVVFDCWRGSYTRERVLTREGQLVTAGALSFPAHPVRPSDVAGVVAPGVPPPRGGAVGTAALG